MKSILKHLADSEQFRLLRNYVEKREGIDIFGITPTFKPYMLAGIAHTFERNVLWITSSWDSCEKMFEATHSYMPDEIKDRLVVFPEFRETGDQDLTPALRMKALKYLSDGNPLYIIAPFKALLQNCEDSTQLFLDSLNFEVGMEVSLDETIDKLENLGYRRNYEVGARGEYSRRGGILDIYPSTADPVRIEFFGDEIDSIRSIDIDSQVSTGKIRSILIYPKREYKRENKLLDILPENTVVVVDDPAVIKFYAKERDFEDRDLWGDFQFEIRNVNPINIASWEGREDDTGIRFNTRPMDTFAGNIDGFIHKIMEWRDDRETIVVSTQQLLRFKSLFREMGVGGVKFSLPDKIKNGDMVFLPGVIGAGFYWVDRAFRIISDKDILGATPRKRRILRTWDRTKAVNLDELKPGDRVVHISHGIGEFLGLKSLNIERITKEFVEIEYRKGDKLFVPVQQLDLIQKYIGPEGRATNLSLLGGKEWVKTRRRVRISAQAIAKELLRLYAEREQSPGFTFSKDSLWQWELEASFPYEETPDQDEAIVNVKKDMESTRPMDRLICGDAGYGKTEVALRAAFKTIQDGKQVAMLVPTTILASQHYETFRSRLAPFPTEVEMLSRFRSKKERKETISKLETGEVDVVIGTHRLISKDIKFKDLGLLVIDEEQLFGVVQKEKLKKLKSSVDVLTMTATPIPRTLHLSLSGIRDISTIKTPPEDRLPVKTHLMEYDKELIRAAIIREIERGGQVFFLHNRVKDIERVAQEIRRLVPFAKIGVGHGQMNEDSLELLMIDFLEGNFDVLVCTTIIGSGIDIPNVNTIIINNAQNFGLAQLYQLRGRVGRSNYQSYAYLLYPPHIKLSEEAEKRLEVIKEFTHLGSGFQIAMKDLEIRGAGNLLGSEQSGYIAAVGFDLYCQLLKEAVEEQRGVKRERKIEPPVIDFPIDTYIPETYIADPRVKLEMYRKISKINKIEGIGKIVDEFRDRFGPLPKEVKNLLEILKIKLLAWDVGVPSIKEMQKEVHILLPAVHTFSLRRIQKIYDKIGLITHFNRSTLVVENLFGKKKKSLLPDKNYGDPMEWVPKLIKLMTYLKRSGK